MTKSTMKTVELPEYIPDNLGAPFKVVLKNSVRQLVDEKTGEIQQTIIPNPRGLLQRIAITRLLIARKLSGQEIKFIRKSLRIKATDLSEMIGVSPEHLSRCEAGERVLSIGVEKCLRMAVLLEVLKVPDEAERVCEKSDDLKARLERYREALSKLRTIIKGMDIPPAYDVADAELCLAFHVVKRDEGPSLFDGPDEEDWTDEQALAA
jgi:DNA-binding transcriptional regulator YiaG